VEFANQKWIYTSLKADVDNALILLVKDPNLWNKKEFESIKLNSTATKLLAKPKTPSNTIELNKNLILSVYSNYINP
ncbi:hypothetical protein NAI81_13020, partial [Francisella tularensis subsp. holarctica]|uniref:hypothetical protein n=1 Tax=Francisella tularensis TaxID=263 RepID=UPI002381B135